MLIGPKLYPSEVAVKFNGGQKYHGNKLFLCYRLKSIVHCSLFFNVGSIKLKSDQAASACTR